MAWTQGDIDQVRAAVVALAAGKRAVSVTYAGPPSRSVQYSDAQLGELRDLLADMERSISSKPSYRLATTRKGL